MATERRKITQENVRNVGELDRNCDGRRRLKTAVRNHRECRNSSRRINDENNLGGRKGREREAVELWTPTSRDGKVSESLTSRERAGQRPGVMVIETRWSTCAAPAAADGSGSTGRERRAPAGPGRGVSVLVTEDGAGDCGEATTRRPAEHDVSGGATKSVTATGGDGGMNQESASTACMFGLSLKSHVKIRRISVYATHKELLKEHTACLGAEFLTQTAQSPPTAANNGEIRRSEILL